MLHHYPFTSRIYIGNIKDVEKDEVRSFFSKFGVITDIWIARNPPGFGYITFEKEEEATQAIREADGDILQDKKIIVQLAKPRVKRPM